MLKKGKKIDICRYARSLGIELIKGMEISCDTDVEDVHILAFGCDWDCKFFRDLDAQTQNSKIESYKKLIQVLNENKIHISWESILENEGRPLEPGKIQKKYIFEMITKKGYTKSWNEAKLMIKQNPVFDIKREKPNPLDVISGIHEAGGIAILAHL